MAVRRSSSRPTPMKELEGAKIRIREVVNDGLSEAVVIANEGHMDQPLTGWALASLKGLRVFRFPDGFVLPPGGTVTVDGQVISREGVRHEPPKALGWTDEAVWNNRGDIAVLFDYQGEEVDRYAYPASIADRVARLRRKRLYRGDDGGYRLEDEPTGLEQERGRRIGPPPAPIWP